MISHVETFHGDTPIPVDHGHGTEEWACQQCTFKNSSTEGECVQCKHRRIPGERVPGAATNGPPALPDWTCTACSSANRGIAPSCMVCGSDRPLEIIPELAKLRTNNVTPRLERALRAEAPKKFVNIHAVVARNLVHFSQHRSHGNDAGSGWACGWRNTQMLVAALQAGSADHKLALAYGDTVPSIFTLQCTLEAAWREGFDAAGAKRYGGAIRGTDEWIGPAEVAALLRFKGIRAEVIEFYNPPPAAVAAAAARRRKDRARNAARRGRARARGGARARRGAQRAPEKPIMSFFDKKGGAGSEEDEVLFVGDSDAEEEERSRPERPRSQPGPQGPPSPQRQGGFVRSLIDAASSAVGAVVGSVLSPRSRKRPRAHRAEEAGAALPPLPAGPASVAVAGRDGLQRAVVGGSMIAAPAPPPRKRGRSLGGRLAAEKAPHPGAPTGSCAIAPAAGRNPVATGDAGFFAAARQDESPVTDVPDSPPGQSAPGSAGALSKSGTATARVTESGGVIHVGDSSGDEGGVELARSADARSVPAPARRASAAAARRRGEQSATVVSTANTATKMGVDENLWRFVTAYFAAADPGAFLEQCRGSASLPEDPWASLRHGVGAASAASAGAGAGAGAGGADSDTRLAQRVAWQSILHAGRCPVHVSTGFPLYLQHDGHSRTLVGAQLRRPATLRAQGADTALLVLDPQTSQKEMERALGGSNIWQRHIKRGLSTFNKPVHQIVVVRPGIMSSEERDRAKVLAPWASFGPASLQDESTLDEVVELSE